MSGADDAGLGSLREAVRDLPPRLRLQLADRWLEAALDEHASIAAFSRFSLHLMAVGAPPDLIAAAHEAALDELAHAQRCFDIAGIYAGEPAGPGPMPLPDGFLGPQDLASVAAAAVAEGCVGETVAALEARTLARVAGHPTLQATLSSIAEDEQQHAALSWRFAGWALGTGGPEVREAIARAFAQTADAQPGPRPADDPAEAELLAHGVATPRMRHDTRIAALEDVIAPARAALMG